MSSEVRTNPEQRSSWSWERKLLTLLAAAGAVGLYYQYNQDQDYNSEIPENTTTNGSTIYDTRENGEGPEGVLPTAIPLMPEHEDTPFGLNSAAVDIEFNTMEDLTNMFVRMDASPYDVQQENFLYRSFRAPFIPNIDRMNPNTPEDLGLGHTSNAAADYNREQAYYESLITTQSLRDAESTSDVEVVTFRINVTENDGSETVYFIEGGLATSMLMQNQYDNLDPMGFQQILDSLKVITVNGQRVWDITTPEQRLNFAIAVWDGLDAQREFAPLGTPVERPLTFINDRGQTEVLAVTNTAGEDGILVRRIQRTQNGEQQPTQQRLTSECVVVIEQPYGDHTELSRGEISRFEHLASVMTLDLTALNRIAENNDNNVNGMLNALADAIIHDHAAYERVSLDTTYAGFPESQTEEGDSIHFMRPNCTIAVEVQPTAIPEISTPEQPQQTPPPEETPPPTRTPTSEPPKTDPYETNPDGTTPEEMPTEAPADDTNSDEANDSGL